MKNKVSGRCVLAVSQEIAIECKKIFFFAQLLTPEENAV
jgi:hypothetical protein